LPANLTVVTRLNELRQLLQELRASLSAGQYPMALVNNILQDTRRRWMVRSEEALETLLAASAPAEPGGTTPLQQLPMMLFATHLLRVGYRLRTREALALAHAMQLSGNDRLMDSLFAHLLHSDRVEASARLARLFLARGSYELAFDCFVAAPGQSIEGLLDCALHLGRFDMLLQILPQALERYLDWPGMLRRLTTAGSAPRVAGFIRFVLPRGLLTEDEIATALGLQGRDDLGAAESSLVQRYLLVLDSGRL
jgi:tetratricopeptide (TPR) repeat protein